MTPALEITTLRFQATADSDIIWPKHKGGNALRNGLADTMLEVYCPERKRSPVPTAEHAAVCPACYLLAANPSPGRIPRGYAIIPFFGFGPENQNRPFPIQTKIKSGERFSFGLTLFGDTVRFMPHFVLAFSQLGRSGVGIGREKGDGRFTINGISSVNPFTQQAQTLLEHGETTVQLPDLTIRYADMLQHVQPFLEKLKTQDNLLTITFHSMMRLTKKGTNNKEIQFKQPDFPFFFARSLFHTDELNRSFGNGERRPKEHKDHLDVLASKVSLIESNTNWFDEWSAGNRDHRNKKGTPISGFVGTATFYADDWSQLVPHLLWGQATQTGKSTVRGNGIFEVAKDIEGYWHQVSCPKEGIKNSV
jgi:hypothetical protein